MKTKEILYHLGVEKNLGKLSLQEKKDIFQYAMTNYYEGFWLENVINFIPMKIRNEELQKGLVVVREKSPKCLNWHFSIAKLLTEPKRNEEMIRIFKESNPYGNADYSALCYRIKYINEVSEPDRTDGLEELLRNLIRKYCLEVDFPRIGFHAIFPKIDCEKVIDLMVDNKRLEKIKKIADDFFDQDLLEEARETVNFFLSGSDRDIRIMKIMDRIPFVERFTMRDFWMCGWKCM